MKKYINRNVFYVYLGMLKLIYFRIFIRALPLSGMLDYSQLLF